MLETLISGLVLAAISATAFVAYKHPAEFKGMADRLILPLVFVLTLVLSVLWGMIFDSVNRLHAELLDNPAKSLSDVDYVVGNLRDYVTTVTWIGIAFMAFVFYIVFLLVVPPMLHSREEQAES